MIARDSYNGMTVGETIELLQRLPKDAPVRVSHQPRKTKRERKAEERAADAAAGRTRIVLPQPKYNRKTRRTAAALKGLKKPAEPSFHRLSRLSLEETDEQYKTRKNALRRRRQEMRQ